MPGCITAGVIIEAVRLHGELTRAELARLTALTPQTVSNIVAELEQMDILTSHQPRGAPAAPWTASGAGELSNPASAWSIGIHLDHQTLIVVSGGSGRRGPFSPTHSGAKAPAWCDLCPPRWGAE